MATTANKKQSKKRVIRLKLGSRLKTAINLVVVRGVNVAVGNGGRRKLVMNEQEAIDEGDKWILPGIRPLSPHLGFLKLTRSLAGRSYIFHPSVEVYRMSYHDLIPLVRIALRSIWDSGMKLEKKWELEALHDRYQTSSKKTSHCISLLQSTVCTSSSCPHESIQSDAVFFSEEFGVTKSIDLIPDGSNIAVVFL